MREEGRVATLYNYSLAGEKNVIAIKTHFASFSISKMSETMFTMHGQ